MQRLERVINLINALIDTSKPLTREDIQRRVPGYSDDPAASRRAFERDKATLRDIGIPIVAQDLDENHPDDGTGYYIPKESYQLPDPGLTREELAALSIALAGTRLPTQAATAALWKLGGTPTSATDFDPNIDLATDERLATIFAARRSRTSISFSYSGQQRMVDPHHISYRNGHWYIRGHDHDRSELRTYRLDRVSGSVDVVTGSTFTAPTIGDQPWLQPWEMGDETPKSVRIEFDADHATLAIDQTNENAVVEQRPNGSALLELTVTNTDALFTFVLGFLHHAEILGPPDTRQAFVDHVSRLASSTTEGER
jgi:proteasome accessory factor B